MQIESFIFQFLQKHLQGEKRLLLALSGGVDSLSLAHLLLECQKKIPFTFEVAHIDHNARAESLKEATLLSKWALKHQIEFHLEKLEGATTKNSEEVFREKRYAYFLNLFKEKKYQALLVAHHQNDLEETVFKRVLEGAALENLSPLKEISSYKGMEVWRPLLNHSKRDLIEYAEKKGLTPFIDPTNFDGSNLRSKMRETIIPNLEKEFGKNIRSNLKALSELSANLESYMDQRVDLDSFFVESYLGAYYDFSESSFHPFELSYGLKKSLKKRGLHLGRGELKNAVEWILNKCCQKKCIKGLTTLHFDRGRVFILPTEGEKLPHEKIFLKEGTHSFGIWTLIVEKGETGEPMELSSWKKIFQEKECLKFQLPLGEYFLRKSDLKRDRLFFGKRLTSYLEDQKIPHCLRNLVPVIASGEKIVAEFFTGKKILNSENASLNISLSCKKD